ncbi:rhomboid family intramembrane serine protease [Profundibacterium mesophilum]|uniref:Rhomboid family protein n=1 Tax=Profundibacterium mesophilum KAUST100406-0324 TaxID=1037889 RepID=A0A921NS03_9RHOB|nr:rhomboid family intramembrane serine protease [Profundibacterium mesophilum]KAF0675334.1 rhomboid family protein [Profundibacterium mesophilum KAUST100406-0324]
MTPFGPDHTASPFNSLPPVVVALALVIGGIELVFQLGDAGLAGGAGAVGWRLDALNAWAFSPGIMERMVQTGSVDPRQLVRMVTYLFVHMGFSHVLFVIVFLLALGKLVGEAFSTPALLAVFFGAGIAGAAVYGLIPGMQMALIGGYPAVYGLIGAYTYILWTGLGAAGESRARAFTLIGFLLGIQLFFAFALGGGNDWIGDIAGFAAGFLISFAVSPGGWRRVMDRTRRRN